MVTTRHIRKWKTFLSVRVLVPPKSLKKRKHLGCMRWQRLGDTKPDNVRRPPKKHTKVKRIRFAQQFLPFINPKSNREYI